MLPWTRICALLAATLLVAAPRPALADAPPSPPAAEAPAKAEPRGVIVVAAGEGATPAARALAMEAYRDPALRPSIDEPTARVLAGDAPPQGASAKLQEVAQLRAAAARAEPELVARRLLASLGVELGAKLVVTVAVDGGRPTARALRSATAAFERVELGATVETSPEGAKTYRWPGASTTLRGLLGVAPGAPSEPIRPLAPAAPAAPAAPKPYWKSPWFWGTAGAVAAAGLTVLILSRVTSSPGDVHLTGRVGP